MCYVAVSRKCDTLRNMTESDLTAELDAAEESRPGELADLIHAEQCSRLPPCGYGRDTPT